MNEKEYLIQKYANYDEHGRLVSKHGRVEFATTMHYIQKYLKAGMKVIEIGAATGRYSHTLAQMGYEVDAVELLECNIEKFKENTMPEETVTITQGDARDLSAFADNTYDITLLLGPMYHLFTTEDKLKALSEAIRVTKPNGIVFVAYCMMDATILHYGFVQGNIHDILQQGLLDIETFTAKSNPCDIFELHRREDIDILRSHFNVEQLHFVATDGYTNHIRPTMAEMDEKTYELYLKYHLTICERPDMIGITHHALDIFRKNSSLKKGEYNEKTN